eukprot:3225697-Prymnesium_polylepis.1
MSSLIASSFMRTRSSSELPVPEMAAVNVCAFRVSAVPSPIVSKSASTAKPSFVPSPSALNHNTCCATPPSIDASTRTKSARSVPRAPLSANLPENHTDAHDEILAACHVSTNGSRPPSPSRSCATRNGRVKPKYGGLRGAESEPVVAAPPA